MTILPYTKFRDLTEELADTAEEECPPLAARSKHPDQVWGRGSASVPIAPAHMQSTKL